MNWIKEHPYLAGGLVLGLVILFFVFRRSGSSSAQTVSSGPSEALQAAQLQSGTQIALAQMQATAQQNQTNAAVAATQIAANRDIVVAQLKQQEDLQNIVTSGQVQEHTTDAALEAVKVQTGAQVQLAQIQTQGQVDIAGMQAQTMQEEYQAATEQAKIIAEAQTQQEAYITAVQLGQQDVQKTAIETTGQVDLAQIEAQQNEYQAALNLQQNLQEQKDAAVSAWLPFVGGSQNRTAIIASAIGAPSVGIAAEAPNAGSTSGGFGVSIPGLIDVGYAHG